MWPYRAQNLTLRISHHPKPILKPLWRPWVALQTPKLPPVDLTPNPNDSGSPHCPPLGCLSRGGVGVGGLQGVGGSHSRFFISSGDLRCSSR